MATIKSFTSLEQSKVLAEILPLESADMCFNTRNKSPLMTPYSRFNEFFSMEPTPDFLIPCWSLASLLNVLPFPNLSKDKLGSGRIGWMVSAYPDNCRYDSCWHDNPIDTCYEMIVKLHEQKLL